MLTSQLYRQLSNDHYQDHLIDLYQDQALYQKQKQRYLKLINDFEAKFGNQDVSIVSAPGRSEVCGNHTDHQHGRVVACALNLDAIAVVSKSKQIKIYSDGMDIPPIDPQDLHKQADESGTSSALVKGVLASLHAKGYQVGGFKAMVTSDVLMGAGMSSSAAFETLIGVIVSELYNGGEISPVEIAQAGQFSENEYFGKPCGLMDQMASSVGSLITIDFKNEQPQIEKLALDLDDHNYALCIVDTLGSHADLTSDYAAIPSEMKQVAHFFEKRYLREVNPEEFYQHLKDLRLAVGDRAVLRALHFFSENNRVELVKQALKDNDFESFKNQIKASGDSSYKYLQNVYSPRDAVNQAVAVGLAVSETLLQDKGVCRVHGGGFAGTIQAFVDKTIVSQYQAGIEAVFGENTCHILKIRKYGGIKVI